MFNDWSRAERIGLMSLFVGIVGCVAAVAVIPEVRAWLRLRPNAMELNTDESQRTLAGMLPRRSESPLMVDELTLRELCGRRLRRADLQDLSPHQLEILRNAIFALHGRPFVRKDLQRYFGRQAWYSVDPAYSEQRLTAVDHANVALIQSIEIGQ